MLNCEPGAVLCNLVRVLTCNALPLPQLAVASGDEFDDAAGAALNANFCVTKGEALQIEVDVSDKDDATKLVWANATVQRIDVKSQQFYVSVVEWASLPKDADDYEPEYEDGPYIAAQEGAYVEGYDGRWRRDFCVTKGEALQIEVDVSDKDDATKLVWANATVQRIDVKSQQFYVSVVEWASLPKDADDYEPEYEDGPYIAAQEGAYVEGYDGRWRRANNRQRMAKLGYLLGQQPTSSDDDDDESGTTNEESEGDSDGPW